MTPEECPNCGADVPPRAKACPECGADESTGWNEDAVSQRLGIPSEGFDYESFVDEEFSKPQKPRLRWCWQLTGIVVLLILLGGLLHQFWR